MRARPGLRGEAGSISGAISISGATSPRRASDLRGCGGGEGLASSPLTASRRALMALRTSRSMGARPREADPQAPSAAGRGEARAGEPHERRPAVGWASAAAVGRCDFAGDRAAGRGGGGRCVCAGDGEGVSAGVAGSPGAAPFRPSCGALGSERAHAVSAHAVVRSRTPVVEGTLRAS